MILEKCLGQSASALLFLLPFFCSQQIKNFVGLFVQIVCLQYVDLKVFWFTSFLELFSFLDGHYSVQKNSSTLVSYNLAQHETSTIFIENF
jgi:hypothetical protein